MTWARRHRVITSAITVVVVIALIDVIGGNGASSNPATAQFHGKKYQSSPAKPKARTPPTRTSSRRGSSHPRHPARHAVTHHPKPAPVNTGLRAIGATETLFA